MVGVDNQDDFLDFKILINFNTNSFLFTCFTCCCSFCDFSTVIFLV